MAKDVIDVLTDDASHIIWFKGATGTGKTMLAQYVTAQIGAKLYQVNCDGEMGPDDFFGCKPVEIDGATGQNHVVWKKGIVEEAMTGRFRISLAEYGLVEAMKKLRAAGRTARQVRPGEYVTDVNIANMWIKQDIFDRNVKFYEADAVTVSDADFSTEHTRGYGVLAPGGGSTLVDASGRVSSDFVLEQVSENFPSGTVPATTVLIPAAIQRPEGHFGTGQTFRVLLPETAQKAIARTVIPQRPRRR